MPNPIVVTITATPDPDHDDKLNLTVNPQTVFLSLEDEDEVQWVCQGGSVEVNFAPVTNPFDPNASSGGQYQAGANGSILSGPMQAGQLDPNADAFRAFKYSILVKSADGKRAGALDPRVMGRGRRVYYRAA